MYTVIRFFVAILFLAPGFSVAQFAITSSANPAQVGAPITFTVQDVTGYTNGWSTPPDMVIGLATDLNSLAVTTLGSANIITKSKYQLTTNSLLEGRYSIKFIIARGDTSNNSDTLVQIVTPRVVPQAVPTMSLPNTLALIAIMLLVFLCMRTRQT